MKQNNFNKSPAKIRKAFVFLLYLSKKNMFDLRKLAKQAIKKIYKEKTGCVLTSEQADNRLSFKDNSIESDILQSNDPEIEKIISEETIQRQAYILRSIVSSYDSLLRSKQCKAAKRYASDIRQNHNEVLTFFNSDLYKKTIEYAQYNIFFDKDLKIKSINEAELRLFFYQYTRQPSLFKIEELMWNKYGIVLS